MHSLYLHIPFCKSKCAYCSFYSLTEDYKEEYIDALIRCVKFYGNKTLKTVYIGGGTPSVIPPSLMGKLIESIHKNFDVSKDAEFTVELNPESVTEEFLRVLKDGNVNRLSLGIQSMNDNELCAIGRIHSEKNVYTAIDKARKLGFYNISGDLIFGLPLQSEKSFEESVLKVRELDLTHISCYNLQIEKGTKLYGSITADEDKEANMYERLCEIMSDYRHYEISNFCKEGYHSKHNSVYWTGEDYLGLGPAAHSKIGNKRTSFDADIKKFISKQEFTFDREETIQNETFEKIMLGLRTDNGVPLSMLQNSIPFINQLVSGGFAHVTDNVLKLTDKGFYLSNTIISNITAKEC